MAPAIENAGTDCAGHPARGCFACGDAATSQLCSPHWFSQEPVTGTAAECCSPSPQGEPRAAMLPPAAEPEAGDPAVAGRSNEASILPHWMDPTRVASWVGERGPKAESSSPGPSTPMQAPPAPQQQKPREAPEAYTVISSTSMAHAFQPTKMIWGRPMTSRPLPASSPAHAQDPVQSQKENALTLSPPNLYAQHGGAAPSLSSSQKGLLPLPSYHHRVGHPPLNRALATLGTPMTTMTSLLSNDLQLHLHSRPAPAAEPGQSSFSIADLDRLITASGCRGGGLGPKAEPYEYPVDAGLSLGFHPPPQSSGFHQTPSGHTASQPWQSTGARSGGHGNGLSFAPKTPSEGMVFLQLAQGAAADAHAEGPKHTLGQNGLLQSNGGGSEPSLGQVQERFFALRGAAEHGAQHPFADQLHDRPKKRMKRRMLDPTITSYEARERTLDMDEDQYSERNGHFLADQEDSGSSHPPNGPTGAPSPGSRAKVLDKVLAKIFEMPMEPKTMVVKKTPKRVHNSNPNLLSMRTELSMLESLEFTYAKSQLPHLMFTPWSTPGMSCKMMASDLAHSSRGPPPPQRPLDMRMSQGGESVLDIGGHCSAREGGSGRWQPPLPGSRLYTVPAYSPMPTPNQTFSAGEPSLPLTLNFSPKPPGPMLSSPKASTGMSSAEEEWGKSLALSATPAALPAEMESSTSESKPLSYQERYKKLQLFLKKCDEDDQSDLLNALRSLSAAARSGHAVGLEQRAMLLSVEEGKEMARVKSLNIMGQRANPRGQQAELGGTPQGPRLPAFSTPTGDAMRMLMMSGSTPASAAAHMLTPDFA